MRWQFIKAYIILPSDVFSLRVMSFSGTSSLPNPSSDDKDF